MATDRRRFLLASAAAGGAWLAGPAHAGSPMRTAYLASTARPDGSFALAALAANGTVEGMVTLPGRGHAFAVRPGGREAVAFARRPGAFALAFRLPAGDAYAFAPAEGRHFYGHGVFSSDGRLLYAPENDFESGAGRIGIYDATDRYRRVGEFDSHGIGPHDIARRGDVLVVANGGIRTHPDMNRQKLNLDTMRASLVWLDARTGRLERKTEIPAEVSKLSLRHMALTPDGTVVVGGQWQGARDEVPLLAWHARPGAGLQPFEGVAIGRDLHGYIGSVAVDRSGVFAAVTSPRAGAVEAWHIETGRKALAVRVADASGLSATCARGRFLVSSGTGRLHTIDVASGVAEQVHGVDASGIMFDNHMLPVS